MKARKTDDDLGLGAEDMARINGAARASITPGLGGIVGESEGQQVPRPEPSGSPAAAPIRSTDPLPGKRHARGRRMT